MSLNFADRFDRTNNLYANDVDKNQVAGSKNVPVIDLGDSGSSNLLNENPRTGLIALQGCCSSEASQLLTERMCYNNLLKITIYVFVCVCVWWGGGGGFVPMASPTLLKSKNLNLGYELTNA